VVAVQIVLDFVNDIKSAWLRKAAIRLLKTNKFLHAEKLFMTHSVSELLFHGYKQSAMLFFAELYELFHIPLPSFVPADGYFGLLRNVSLCSMICFRSRNTIFSLIVEFVFAFS
jgi:hypothetical protein